MNKSSADASSRSQAPNAQRQSTQEEIFMKRLGEMNLRAKYDTESRNQYGVEQIRFWIYIYRGNDFLEKTSSGFTSKSADYREMGFEQANRRLNTIESYKRHLPSSSYATSTSTANSPAEEQERDDYTDHRNYY